MKFLHRIRSKWMAHNLIFGKKSKMDVKARKRVERERWVRGCGGRKRRGRRSWEWGKLHNVWEGGRGLVWNWKCHLQSQPYPSKSLCYDGFLPSSNWKQLVHRPNSKTIMDHCMYLCAMNEWIDVPIYKHNEEDTMFAVNDCLL